MTVAVKSPETPAEVLEQAADLLEKVGFVHGQYRASHVNHGDRGSIVTIVDGYCAIGAIAEACGYRWSGVGDIPETVGSDFWQPLLFMNARKCLEREVGSKLVTAFSDGNDRDTVVKALRAAAKDCAA